MAGQVLGRPALGRLGQPGLGDPAERQSSGMAEDPQVPGVFGLLGAGISQSPSNIAGQRPQQRLGGLAGNPLDLTGPDRADLFAPQGVADRPQAHIGDLGAAADALLDAEEHLDHHLRAEPAQADLAGLGDRRLGQGPVPLVYRWLGGDGGAPPHVVGGAPAVLALRCSCAGRHLARAQGRQRPQQLRREPRMSVRMRLRYLPRSPLAGWESSLLAELPSRLSR